MSYPINQKINPYSPVAMGVNNSQAPNVDADTIAQGITQNSVLKGVSSEEGEKNPWLTPVLTIPVWGAMVLGMDKFNGKCGGDYDKSLVGRVGAWGEKAELKVREKFQFIEKIEAQIINAKSWIKTKIVNPSKILSAIFNTPAQPDNKMALMMFKGTPAEIASNAIQKVEKHLENNGTLKINGKEVTDSAKLKAYVAELAKDTHTDDGIKKVMELLEQQGNDILKTTNSEKTPLLSKVLPKPIANILNRETHFSEDFNKLKAFKNGNKTVLGKALPKGMLRVLEGLTNGTAGGKIAMIMGAFFIADAIKKTIDAPKGNGEKRKTFAENLIYNVGWYLTAPLGLAMIYKPGGLKYIGFDKNQVKEYLDRLNKFNEPVKTGQIKDKAVYDAELQKLKTDLKKIFKKSANSIEIKATDSIGIKVGKFFANLIRKPLQLGGKILMFGTAQPEAFNPKGIGSVKSKGNLIESILEKMEQFFKNGKAKGVKGFAGGAMRFGLFMFVIAPFLGKIAAKCSHIVFGKPTKSVLDEEKESEQEKEKERQIISPIMPQQQVQTLAQVQTPTQSSPVMTPMQPVQQNANLTYNQTPTEQGNMVNMYKTQPTTGKEIISSSDEPVRTYIPSSDGVKIDKSIYQEQENKANAAIAKSYNAEKQAGKRTTLPPENKPQ